MAFGARAAIGAKAVALVPVQQRLSLAGNREVARRQHKGAGAHLLEPAFTKSRLGFARKIDREQRLAAVQAQEYAGRAIPFGAPGQEPGTLIHKERPGLPERQK